MKTPVPPNHLRSIVDASGLKRGQIAADLNVAVKTLYNWEMMQNDIPGYALFKLCDLLAIAPSDVYGDGEISELMAQKMELMGICDGLSPDGMRALMAAARGIEEEYEGDVEKTLAEARYQEEIADSWRE